MIIFENLISRIEIADELGVEPQTIARWERDGKFPRAKHWVSTRLIYYDRAEVRRQIESRSEATLRRLRTRRPS